MKKLKKLNKLLLLLISLFLGVSCVVDDDVNGNLKGIENGLTIVGFESASRLESYFEDLGLVDVDLQVNVLGGNDGKELLSDIAVSFEIDPSSTAIEGNEFILTGNSFVIPKGEVFGSLPIQINTGGFDPNQPTILVLKLISTDSSSIISALRDTYTITFVGCQSNHAGTYTNPDLPSGAAGLATIVETSPNTFTASAVPYLGSGGGVNPIPFSFTNVCGDINITSWAFSGSNLIVGTGALDADTGALTFKYIAYSGTSVGDGILFDFSSDDDASTYIPQ